MAPDAVDLPSRSGARPRLELVRPQRASGDDEVLVRALRSGEAWAAVELFDRHALDVRRVLLRVLGPDAELQDLIHDVFVRALEGIDRLDDPDRLRSWLVSICVHTARERIRKRRRRWWMILLPHDEVPETAAAPEDHEDNELMRATYRVLDRLEPDDRMILALRLLEGMDVMEVARLCGVSRATIKRRVIRAQDHFRKLAATEPALREWSEGAGT